MNIMALAHKKTREVVAACLPAKVSYRSLFAAALTDYHKEYKAMQKEQAVAMFTADTIAKFEARVVALQAYAKDRDADKWLVTCGGMPVDFEPTNQAWPWADAEKASKWNSPQFARANAQKVRNNAGEYGVAVNVGEYCQAEIVKLKELIRDMKTA